MENVVSSHVMSMFVILFCKVNCDPVQKSCLKYLFRCRYLHEMVLSFESLALTYYRIHVEWRSTDSATSSSWSARSSEWLSSASRLARFCTSSVSWRQWSSQTASLQATAVTRFILATINHIVSRFETDFFCNIRCVLRSLSERKMLLHQLGDWCSSTGSVSCHLF